MFEPGRVHVADCLVGMAGLPPDSVDSIVTDPPYGLGFMGKDWDHGVPGVPFWQAALRVAKPGAHLLAFGGTRTFHRLACAIEDAGWEIRDSIGFLHGPLLWVTGQGFPKSLDVSKAIDKAAGAEREEIAPLVAPAGNKGSTAALGGSWQEAPMQTAPATPAAKLWQGWGTALKPAWEPIIVARKPLEGTVAANVLKHGTGAMNIDGCRIPLGQAENPEKLSARSGGSRGFQNQYVGGSGGGGLPPGWDCSTGRFPANLVHDGSAEVLAGFPEAGGGFGARGTSPNWGPASGRGGTMESVGFGDSGSASRFFYCAKAGRGEREAGLEGMLRVRGGCEVFDPTNRDGTGTERMNLSRNHHPTVKPISLMRWLVRLVTPPGGLVLDPFAGSGSTLCAAVLEGFRGLGFDLSAEYAAIANARIDYWHKHPEGPQYEPDAPQDCPGQGTLFGDANEA